MIKFLQCLILGHEYEIASHTSVPPKPLEAQGDLSFSLEMIVVGYAKTIQTCRRCGKIKTTTTLGV